MVTCERCHEEYKEDSEICPVCSLKMARLLPAARGCPFCGSRNLTWMHNVVRNQNGLLGSVSCNGCRTLGPLGNSVEKMVEFWNLRSRKTAGQFWTLGSMDDADYVDAVSCPFCLAPATGIYNAGSGADLFLVCCHKCGASGPQPADTSRPFSKESAIKAWAVRSKV